MIVGLWGRGENPDSINNEADFTAAAQLFWENTHQMIGFRPDGAQCGGKLKSERTINKKLGGKLGACYGRRKES